RSVGRAACLLWHVGDGGGSDASLVQTQDVGDAPAQIVSAEALGSAEVEASGHRPLEGADDGAGDAERVDGRAELVREQPQRPTRASAAVASTLRRSAGRGSRSQRSGLPSAAQCTTASGRVRSRAPSRDASSSRSSSTAASPAGGAAWWRAADTSKRSASNAA